RRAGCASPRSRCKSPSCLRLPLVLFFFSSRRRHTRFKCDWSSDVCSSDLRRSSPTAVAISPVATYRPQLTINVRPPRERLAGNRSEERRVGKECRYGRAAASADKKREAGGRVRDTENEDIVGGSLPQGRRQ